MASYKDYLAPQTIRLTLADGTVQEFAIRWAVLWVNEGEAKSTTAEIHIESLGPPKSEAQVVDDAQAEGDA